MAAEQVSVQGGFVQASSSTDWYKNLERYGSCLRLYDLLEEQRQLIHRLGPEGVTVLHKGVEHGCVKLVKFIMVDMFDGEGNCSCSLHGPDYPCLTREGLLWKTCSNGISAVNIAVVSGSPKMVLLLKWAIDMSSCKNSEVTDELSSRKCKDTYRDITKIHSSFMIEKGEATESTNDTENSLVVPDVKDDAIDKIYETDRESKSNKIPKVYSVIEGILNENWGTDQVLMDMLKDRCKKDVDFEFVPVTHVFLHFLVGITLEWDKLSELMISFLDFREKIVKKIFEACNARDDEEGVDRGTMLKTLFSILDPRGRTFLHVAALESFGLEIIPALLRQMEETTGRERGVPSSILAQCVNATDAAGRTILHLLCSHHYSYSLTYDDWIWEKLDWNVSLSPLCRGELEALQVGCFPLYRRVHDQDYDYRPLHLAVIFNSTGLFKKFLSFTKEKQGDKLNALYELPKSNGGVEYFWPFQVAAFLGRTRILEQILQHHKNFNSLLDQGFGNDEGNLPAIHCAALSGQVEAIQLILKYPMYDPIIQNYNEGTALHLLVKKDNINMYFMKKFQILALLHVLPNSYQYKRVQNDFLKLRYDESVPSMYSASEISCINLLLQASIDIWTLHSRTKDFPTPGPMANDEARKWWYNKMVCEVVTLKTSISYSANATSIIAALVATGSFIGPFQPPLGYADSNGYIYTNRSPVRVYLVCNSLSFFFSIASILMAVLPAIPMPKESLYDELFRSQRCLKVAALMLLISIICILISFSSASIAVVSSEWHEKQLVVACIVFGGGICVIVLVIYIIRLLRMLLHKNDRFRRWFAKHMSF